MTLKYTVRNTVPKDLERRLASEMEDWAGLVAKRAAEELEDKTSDWQDRPKFSSRASKGGQNINLTVSTQSKIFKFVDAGTKPHRIPKVDKKRLYINTAYKKVVMFVNHPGSEARRISEEVMSKAGQNLVRIARNRISRLNIK